MSSEGRIAVIGLIASWTFIALPLIYLHLPSELAMISIIKIAISLLTPLAAVAVLLVARKQLILNRGQLVLNRRNQRETDSQNKPSRVPEALC